MYRQKGIDMLQQLSKAQIATWLQSFDTVITDCDGVLWLYSQIIDGAVETINQFKKLKKQVYFCTNNSTKTRQELYEKAQQMGFNISSNEIISTAHSTAIYLKNLGFSKSAYVVGSAGITQELDNVNIKHNTVGPDVMQGSLAQLLKEDIFADKSVGAVIVGFDEHFSFPKMLKAASYLNDANCLFIATNTDERFPMAGQIIPGTGSFVRAIETCSERQPIVIGKPNASICEHLIRDKVIDPARTLMIGDRCNTDILLGYNCGFQTLLVGTGIHTLKDVNKWLQSNDAELHKLVPDVYLPKLGDLLPFMQQ